MLLFTSDGIHDYGLGYLEQLVRVIDSRLESLEIECRACFDPDQFGLLDHVEQTVGWGFASCQTYLVQVRSESSLSDNRALAIGPIRSGGPVALLVHHAANWWKHEVRWSSEDDARARRTREGLAVMDLEWDYPLTEALAKMTDASFPRFQPLVPLLVEWRDELLRTSRAVPFWAALDDHGEPALGVVMPRGRTSRGASA